MSYFDFPNMDTVTLSEKGVPVPIRRVDGLPLKNSAGEVVTLTVHGPDSAAYKRTMQQKIKARFERKGEEEITDATVRAGDEDAADMLAAMVISWSGVRDKEGAEIPCSHSAAKALFIEFPIIRDQIDAFIVKRENFTSPA